MVTTPFVCPLLDEVTLLCTVYERRHEINPFCTSVEDGIKLGIWPGTCPYVSDLPHYKAPRAATPEEIETYTDECLAALDEIRLAAQAALAAASDEANGS